jgi:thiol-disulfide isomerase/thioredoxin
MRSVFLIMAITYKVFAQVSPVVNEVQAAAMARNYAAAESKLAAFRASNGAASDSILALSWLARGALNNRDFAKAETYAAETRKEALAELKHRRLDAEPDLPTALGASIEVHAQALAATGKRAEAVAFLHQEVQTWSNSSMELRIQKNLNLLTMEGKPAPALDITHYVGEKPAPLASLHGHVVLLFFWAHWCGDCKVEAPVLQQLNTTYGPKGLAIVAPTQHYGYAASGEEAPRDVETKWIDEMRQRYYARVGPMTAPLSEQNFRTYGASSMPTFVLIDKQGIVRLYYPGKMSYDELATAIEKLLR